MKPWMVALGLAVVAAASLVALKPDVVKQLTVGLVPSPSKPGEFIPVVSIPANLSGFIKA